MLVNNRVLFIDAEALVIDKPAGLPVTAVRDGSLSLENHLAGLAFGFQRWPTIVHRLDRDTSGCLLLARHPKAHKRYSAAFEAGQVTKHYMAVLDGEVTDDSGFIDLPLHKISSAEEGWRMIVDKRGKAARTHWTVKARHAGRTLVEFAPETGRTHQLRVHAATGLGIPIVGDPMYGKGNEPMLLHASRLEVARDPKPPIVADAPLPETFTQAGFGDV